MVIIAFAFSQLVRDLMCGGSCIMFKIPCLRLRFDCWFLSHTHLGFAGQNHGGV